MEDRVSRSMQDAGLLVRGIVNVDMLDVANTRFFNALQHTRQCQASLDKAWYRSEVGWREDPALWP